MSTKRCPFCKEELPESASFCPACFKEFTSIPVKHSGNVLLRKRIFTIIGTALCLGTLLCFGTSFIVSLLNDSTNGSKQGFTQGSAIYTPAETFKHISATTTTEIATETFITAPSPTITSAAAIRPTQILTSWFPTHAPTTMPVIVATPPVPTGTLRPTTAEATTTQKTTSTPKPTTTPAPTINIVVTDKLPRTPVPLATPTGTASVTITEGLFAYTRNGNEATITNYYGADKIITVPSTIGGATVTEIGEYAFQNNIVAEEIHLPDSVVLINKRAFTGCKKLSSIYLSKNLRAIYDYAFADTALKTLILPSTFEIMESNTFRNIHQLESIEVADGGNDLYWSENGVLFGYSDGWFCNLVFYPASKKDANYTLPYYVKQIYHCAFQKNQYLQHVTLAPQLKYIDQLAFNECTALLSVKTYDFLENISIRAFADCVNLRSMNLGANFKFSQAYTFENCPNLVLTVVKDSYGHQYASKYNIPYIFSE